MFYTEQLDIYIKCFLKSLFCYFKTKYTIKNILSFFISSNTILNWLDETNHKMIFKFKNYIDKEIDLYINIDYKNIHINHNCIILNNLEDNTKKYLKEYFLEKISNDNKYKIQLTGTGHSNSICLHYNPYFI